MRLFFGGFCAYVALRMVLSSQAHNWGKSDVYDKYLDALAGALIAGLAAWLLLKPPA